MRILIDIGHPAQFNYLKIPINILSNEHEVYVSYIKRGKLADIINQELKYAHHSIIIKQIGKHRGSIFSIIWDANICRLFQFILFIYRNKIDIGVDGGFPLGLALRIMRRKYIQFDDDFERHLTIFLEKHLADKLYLFPSTIKLNFRKSSNIILINALKEWAYLSPTYFFPDNSVLDEYNLQEGNYIFVREVSTKTINYFRQKEGIISAYQDAINLTKLKVILSLEEKEKKDSYPEDWILLKEPVSDIHSLMYYSNCVISSGDSMAREGAMLGVKSIYCGSRDMTANRFLMDICNFIWAKNYDEFVVTINSKPLLKQEVIRNILLKNWEDVNEIVLESILSLDKGANVK